MLHVERCVVEMNVLLVLLLTPFLIYLLSGRGTPTAKKTNVIVSQRTRGTLDEQHNALTESLFGPEPAEEKLAAASRDHR